MGIFDGIMGNASSADVNYVKKEIDHILLDNERVEQAYKVIRDLIVFTDKRLIIINVYGITGKKNTYRTIPYRMISHYTIETAGAFEIDAHLTVHVVGGESFTEDFKRDKSINEIQKALAYYVL